MFDNRIVKIDLFNIVLGKPLPNSAGREE